jgi:hypothetical protein
LMARLCGGNVYGAILSSSRHRATIWETARIRKGERPKQKG